MTSEFGKGFLYCIGLFLEHAALHQNSPSGWFNGATDHLIEMTIPQNLTPDLRVRIELWRDDCLSKRWQITTAQNRDNALIQARNFLKYLDTLNGIETEESEYN